MDTPLHVDTIWNSLRPLGNYQRCQIAYLLFMVMFQIAAVVLNFVLYGHVPDFKCNPLHEPLSTYGLPDAGENRTSYEVTYGKCEISVVTNTTNGTLLGTSTLSCKEGYFFDKTEGTTIISEWNLVCDQSGVGELGQTLVMAGQIVGATLFTSLADRYGRKPVFVSTHLLLFIMSLSLTFVPTFVVFAIMRFVIGALQQGMGLAMSIMTLEIVPQEHRGAVGALGQFAWTAFVVILAGIGYFMRNLSWRYIQLVTALASFHALASYWIVDESLRWLIANNRKDEAMKVIQRVARINKVSKAQVAEVMLLLSDGHEPGNRVSCNSRSEGLQPLNGHVVSPLQDVSDDTQDDTYTIATRMSDSSDKTNVIDLFRHRLLLKHSLILWFVWCTNSLTYFGLYLTSSSLTGNRHLNFFLNGLVELPGAFLYALLVNRLGRKRCCVLFHAVTGVALILSVVLLQIAGDNANSSLSILSTVLNYVGKLGIAASFALLFLYTPELYPTNLRNIGLGICSAAARIGGMIAPYSNIFASYVIWGPGVAFGICCILVAFLTLLLPETNGKELPQTVEDYNDWVKRKPKAAQTI
ncbi:organic cation transporter protein-like [Mizuhopecten yessoensis]|uniref:Organic cation transporter protein n=1 Tax=Mizuhopecten yessoensis TaxID=6573 RepID=A0A210QLH6_MIZYE|nr:organic cation transporter protein-like [Mizuhopecten yessoensis]OWF49592.1 Organic cation transporter protein [Mizuhopecten yessoensis]